MNDYSLYLNGIPRKLHAGIPLSRLLNLSAATGTWNGKRPDDIEFAIRLSSPDRFAVDIQDGIKTIAPYPHVYVKKPGSIFTAPPFAPREAFVLIYEGKYWNRFIEMGLNPDRTSWQIESVERIRDVIRQMNRLTKELFTPGAADRLDHRGYLLVQELLLQNQDSKTEGSENERIHAAASFFTLHYAEDWKLDDMLRKHGFSRRTFYRQWKQVFTESPGQFLRNLKMKEAERLLGYEQSIGEIAYRLRFQDESYFIALFRRCYGMTPAEYRKKRIGKQTGTHPGT